MIKMNRSMQRFLLPSMLLVVLLGSGCTRHYVESKSQVELAPVEVKPIHITIDVNIKVDRALDNFFGDLDQAKEDIYEKKDDRHSELDNRRQR
jgi:hypothetical protein